MILFSLLLMAPFSQGKNSRIFRYLLWLFDPREELFRFLSCIIGFKFPQTICGSLSLPSIKSITYAVLIRVCKSNIKIIPWCKSIVQLCHFIFPFATLTRQGRLKHWARNYLFKATIQRRETLDKDCSLSLIIKVASKCSAVWSLNLACGPAFTSSHLVWHLPSSITMLLGSKWKYS